jgi:hypothetical protein
MADHVLPRIYIIGPFRAPTELERRQNIARAEALALHVAEAGALFRCPHTHTAHFDGLLTDAYWIALGLDMLSECDAAVLVKDHDGLMFVPPWRFYLDPIRGRPTSHGSIAEVAWCEAHCRPVLRDEIDLAYFIEEWRKDEAQCRRPSFMCRDRR